MPFRFFLLVLCTTWSGVFSSISGQTIINCDDFLLTQALAPGDYIIGPDVTQIKFRLRGGEGGNARLDGAVCDRRVRGGTGALIEMTFPVSDDLSNDNGLKVGGTIRIYVGQNGQNADRGCNPIPVGVYGGGGGATAVLYKEPATADDSWLLLALAGGGGGGSRPIAGTFRTGKRGLVGFSGGSSGAANGGVNGNCPQLTAEAGAGGSLLCVQTQEERGNTFIIGWNGELADRTLRLFLKVPAEITNTGGTRNNRANGGNGMCGGGAGNTAGGGAGGLSGGAAAETWSGGGGGSYVTSLRGIYDINLVEGVDGASQNIPVRGFVSMDTQVPTVNAVCPNNLTLSLDTNGEADFDPETLFEFPSDLSCDVTNTVLLFTANDFPLPIDLSTVDFTFNCPATPGNVGNVRYLLFASDGSIASECTTPVVLQDNIDPLIGCRDLAVTLNDQGTATITPAQISDGSRDNCALTNLQLSKTTFDCTDVGPNSVTLTVSDAAGNINTCNAAVIVNDQLVARCQNATLVLEQFGDPLTVDDIDVGSTSSCFTITNRQLTTPDFACSGVETVTLTVTNSFGATANCTANVVVVDELLPQARCVNSIDLILDENGQAVVNPADLDNGSTDNCSTVLVFSAGPITFDCASVGNPTGTTFAVADEAGNESLPCVVGINVLDQTPPIARCRTLVVRTLDANGQLTIDPAILNNNSRDNCGADNLQFSTDVINYDCEDSGSNFTTLRVRDASGNESTCQGNLLIVSPSVPQLSCQDFSVTLDLNGQATVTPADVIVSEQVACFPIVTRTLSQSEFGPGNVGTNPVTVTVRNNQQQTNTCNVTVTVNANALPVEWLDFTAKAKDQKRVRLDWGTASESNNHYFQVEHSTDGQQFTRIGRELGAGESSQPRFYHFLHEEPVSGWNYYRIQQVDFTGSNSYSSVAAVRIDKPVANGFTMFPNPSRDVVELSFTPLPREGQLRVLNSQGQVQLSQTISAGQDSFRLLCQDWANGIYYLQLSSQSQRWMQRLVKVE